MTEKKPHLKIFCKKCGFYKPWCSTSDDCEAPENLKDTYHGNYKEYDKKPSRINANNDCDWFKIKIGKMDW